MKIHSPVQLTLLTVALVLMGSPGVKAQDADSTPGAKHPHRDAILTADERTELQKDRQQVFSSNPDLKKEGQDLMDKHASMKDGSAEDKQAFHEKMHAFQEKMAAAIEKIDPQAAPILAKVKAARHHHEAAAGADSGSSDSNQ